jgi:hypothetical protein
MFFSHAGFWKLFERQKIIHPCFAVPSYLVRHDDAFRFMWLKMCTISCLLFLFPLVADVAGIVNDNHFA